MVGVVGVVWCGEVVCEVVGVVWCGEVVCGVVGVVCGVVGMEWYVWCTVQQGWSGM